MRTLYGPNQQAFGHPGAGGSHAFGDPLSGLSFAYVMNQMALSVMPGQRSTAMVAALYAD
jgi:CubicO group peptidase (beta-lactamase class C family)